MIKPKIYIKKVIQLAISVNIGKKKKNKIDLLEFPHCLELHDFFLFDFTLLTMANTLIYNKQSRHNIKAK